MINIKKINILNDFDPSKMISWSIWDDNFRKNEGICSKPESIGRELIEPNLHLLRNEIIFLGLNYARDLLYSFQNFHDCLSRNSNDYLLKQYIFDNNLEKLKYQIMTDLLDIKNSNSKEVYNIIKNNHNILLSSIERLICIFDILNNKSYKVICFGVDCFRYIKKGFKLKNKGFGLKVEQEEENIKKLSITHNGYNIEFYGVYHFSNNGYNSYCTKQLENQLKYINTII